jgi:hypothetical protein
MSFLFIIFQKTFFHGKYFLKKSTGSQGEPIELTIVCTFLGVHNLITTKISKKMKKNLFLYLLLAIVAMSCQKDLIVNDSQSLIPSSSNKSAYDNLSAKKPTAEARADEQRIIAFRDLLEDLKNTSSASATGNEMLVDSTVWNVEALLNASYASAGEPFTSNSVKKDSISVPLNANGAVDESSLPSVYEAVRAKVGAQYHDVNGANKHLIFVDIALKGIRNGSNVANSMQIADLYVTSATGYDFEPASPPPPPTGDMFSAIHNWKWGLMEGRCNPATGLATGYSVGNDAALMLARTLNQRYPRPLIRDYYTDVIMDIKSEIENSNDVSTLTPPFPDGNPTGMDNIRDFLTFSVSQAYPTPDFPSSSNYIFKSCIDVADMNWYYQNYYDIITQFKNTRGLDFISIKIWDNIHLHLDPRTGFKHTVYAHVLDQTFGKYHGSLSCLQICSCDDGSCVPVCSIGSAY